jgi:hypothetical protein
LLTDYPGTDFASKSHSSKLSNRTKAQLSIK